MTRPPLPPGCTRLAECTAFVFALLVVAGLTVHRAATVGATTGVLTGGAIGAALVIGVMCTGLHRAHATPRKRKR